MFKLVHIFKSEDRRLNNNHRPISVSTFSKIPDKLMYHRLLNYHNLNNVIADNQYGFHDGHSTYMALLRMTNDIRYEFDNIVFNGIIH